MQKLHLSIPEPCQENWQQMTPTDQGRFCNACAKEVIDFSMMTDREVLNYFTTLTHDKVCGRALPSQLERTISKPKDPKKRLFWYWNYIVMFFMFFGKGNGAKAQGGIKPVTEINPLKNMDIRGEMMTVGGIKRDDSRVITGKITDINGLPISFASIKIKGTNTGVSADANGAFSIKISSNALLVISGTGFTPKEIAAVNQTTFSTILQKDNDQFVGEFLVVVKQGVSCFGATPRRINQVSPLNTDSLYVIDGTISTKAKAVNLIADDISEIVRLNKSEATALYGKEASNGAVIITTRQSKIKDLDTVAIRSDFWIKGMAGGISFTNIYQDSLLGDTIATVKTLFTDSIKIYPNPVQRNTGFTVSLKLKQAGNYSIQVTDASGKILLLQKFNANAKNHTEKIMSDSRWAGGVYSIRVFDVQNKLVSKSSFIVR